MHRMQRFCEARGRRMIGWDEILEGGAVPGATAVSYTHLILLTNVGAKATPEEVTAGVEDTWEQVRLMREYWGWTVTTTSVPFSFLT